MMAVIKNDIVLFKSQTEDNNSCAYTTILNEHGYNVKTLNAIVFEYINLHELLEKLQNPDNFSGLIFTSPRAVFATKTALKDESLPQRWKSLSNYVVGKSTEKYASDLLNLDCHGSESGSASNLAELIIGENCFSKPFLFPCGNLKKDILPKKFLKENISFDSITVYNTLENLHIEDSFKQATSDFKNIPEFIVYFSPSGVQYTKSLISLFDSTNVKFISIGPSTAEEMKLTGLQVSAVLDKPTPDNLCEAIRSCL